MSRECPFRRSAYPEAAPVGPELSLILHGHRKLFTTFLPRVWIAVLEDQDQQRHLQFPGTSSGLSARPQCAASFPRDRKSRGGSILSSTLVRALRCSRR